MTLDVVENLRHIRNEVRGDTGRDVEWELGDETTFEGGPDNEHSTFEQLVFHVKLPAATPTARPRRSRTSCTSSSRTNGDLHSEVRVATKSTKSHKNQN